MNLLPQLHFVMAGLDPAIHTANPQLRRFSMDPRVKSAGDER